MDKHIVNLERLQKHKTRMLMEMDLKDYLESRQKKTGFSKICLTVIDLVTSFVTQMWSIKALAITVHAAIILYLLWALLSMFFNSR